MCGVRAHPYRSQKNASWPHAAEATTPSNDPSTVDHGSSARTRWGARIHSLFRCLPAALGTILVLVGTASTAAAGQAQPFSLSWRAPEGCPSQAQVEEEIASALAHLQGQGAVEVLAEVTLRETEPGFQLRVRVGHDGQRGERVLPLDDCDDTSRAAALLVALSVGNPPPPSPPPPPPPPPPSPPLPKWSLGLGPHLALGMAPEVSAGVGVSVAFSHSFWRLSARGAGFAASHHNVPGTEVGGSFQLYTAGAFGCAGYPGLPLTFFGCLGGRLDQLTGTGTDVDKTVSTQIGSLSAGVTLEWSLTRRFRLRTEIEAGYPLGEGRFRIKNDPAQVHDVDSLRGEAALELAVVF